MHKMERHHKLLFCFTFANLQFSVGIFSCFSNPLMDPVSTHSNHLIIATLLVLFLRFSLIVACFSACAVASHALIITKHTSWSQSYVMCIEGTRNDYLSSLELQLYFLTHLFHAGMSVAFEITHFSSFHQWSPIHYS